MSLIKINLLNKKEIQLADSPDQAISIVIPVLNEEEKIEKKINNIISQNYDLNKIEIIFYSDGSTDRTEEVILDKIREHQDLNIELLASKENKGRAMAHNRLVEAATNEIIVFTDIETIFEEEYLFNTLLHFADKEVGMVVGRLIFISDTSSVGLIERVYFRYEALFREYLSSLGLLLTGTGAAMAIRKENYSVLSPDEDIDDSLPLIIAQNRKKVLFSNKCIAYDFPVSDVKSQFKARSRMSSKGFTALMKRWELASLYKHFFLSLTLICHKVLKWLSGLWILLIYISSFYRAYFYNDTISIWILYSLALYLAVTFLYILFKNKLHFLERFVSIPFAVFGALWGVLIALMKKTKHAY